MPLRPGYGYETVLGNVNALQREGKTRETAIAEAFNFARKAYFKRFPAGALPVWLAHPKTRRVVNYYNPNTGAPLSEKQLRQHEIFKDSLHLTEKDLVMLRARKNPRDISTREIGRQYANERDKAKAAKLFRDFTGRKPQTMARVPAPRPFNIGVAFGTLVEVVYQSERDGQLYRHTFRKKSRPLVVASPDGKQVQIVGGRFAFTERGIVDK